MNRIKVLTLGAVLALCAAYLFVSPLVAQEEEDAPQRWENPVLKLLKEGKPVIGATITVSSVDVAAQAANMGFDFLWVEMEHSPISWQTYRDMVLATRGLKAMPFARVPVNKLWTAKRALDAGALGVIFPFTSTPELARQAVAACKYPPEGKRGAGPGLASFRWQAPDESYYHFANRNVMVITIIEDQSGVDNIDEICAVPGIDVIYIGPNDLSWQLAGGDRSSPKFKAAMETIIAAAKRHNKILGRPAGSPEQTRQFIEDGFLFFQSPSDLYMMRMGARIFLEPLDKKGFDAREKPLY